MIGRRRTVVDSDPTMRLSQAFRVFFRILGDAEFAARIARAESDPAAATRPSGVAAPSGAPSSPRAAATPASAAAVPSSRRSEAITLLSLLQREGRLVDFLQESIDAYPDAQIGAAVREIHRDTRKALDRVFGLKPAVPTAEGAPHSVPAGYDPSRLRLTGQVSGAPPHMGTVVHPGWEATRCDLPAWTGSEEAARVIAPAEIEIR